MKALRESAIVLGRLIAGGSLVLAAIIKLKGDPVAFALSIDSFKLVPRIVHLPMALYLPWFELVVGAALLLGLWGRQAALLATGLYAVFTIALASVLLRGMSVTCGCFGGLFGGDTVTWFSVARNGIFIAAAAVVLVLGSGRFAVGNGESGMGKGPGTGGT